MKLKKGDEHMTQQKQFKDGEIVWIKSERKKGLVKGRTRSIPVKYLIEIIIEFNKGTQQRTTQLLKLNAEELDVYRGNKQSKQRKPLQIKVKYFDNGTPKLGKIPQGEWIDLRAAETVELKQFEYKLIPLGVGMKLPKGYEVNIVPRSSTFKNFGILQTNSYGVIDNSYSGDNDQYHFPALAMRDTVIQKGDRICQMRLNRIMPNIEFEIVEHLDEISRNGFGSTGIR